MAGGVDVTHAAAGERPAGEEGRTLHILPGFQVTAVMVRRQKVFVDESDGILRQLVLQGKIKSVRCGAGVRGKILIAKNELLSYFES